MEPERDIKPALLMWQSSEPLVSAAGRPWLCHSQADRRLLEPCSRYGMSLQQDLPSTAPYSVGIGLTTGSCTAGAEP